MIGSMKHYLMSLFNKVEDGSSTYVFINAKNLGAITVVSKIAEQYIN